MNPRLFRLLSFLLLAPALSFAAAPNGCAQGSGEYRRDLWKGYRVEFAPAQTGSTADQCRAAVKAADGAAVFEITAPEVFLNDISGNDVNGDGEKDIVIESHRAHNQCCFTYDIITPGVTPALVREITTSVALHFEDRDNDGKIEISGRDNAFEGFDGLPNDLSPAPLAIFRLRGGTMYYVSQGYWAAYERDIQEAKNSIAKSRLEKFKTGGAGSGTGIGAGAQQPSKNALEGRELAESKSIVLQIVLDHLYGGNGAQAWKTLQEMWPYPDYIRVRQLILQARSRGLLSEVNRPPAKAQQAEVPAQPGTAAR